ncbi:MAG: hypothetical protein D6790_06075, partial [Caldilineae bacterium]
EFECGSNYARSMASYALLLAFSGFRFDSARGMIGFDPVHMEGGRFRCFWALHTGWGTVDITAARVQLAVLGGELSLRELEAPFLAPGSVRGVVLKTEAGHEEALAFHAEAGVVHLTSPTMLSAGDVINLFN